MASPLVHLLHHLPKPIKRQLRAARRGIGGSPIQQVFAELERRGVTVRDARALEVFGGDGDLHVRDYAHRVGTLEIWDREPSVESQLRKSFPGARITIGDSFQLIRETQNHYDIVVMDNPLSYTVTPADLFMDSLQKVSVAPVFILNVVCDIDPATRRAWPAFQLLGDVEAILERRRAMFRTQLPEHISLEQMTSVYAELARTLGFETEWSYSRRRHYGHYLVFRLRRLVPA